MVSARTRAIVVGGGIGGPVAALALDRAGIEARVFEAHAGSADHVGSFLNLASNGLDVLKTLGVHERVVAAGFPTPRITMWNGRGRLLADVPNGARLDDGTVSITLLRGALHRELRRAAVERGIAIETGKRLVDVETHAEGVVAHFSDGTSASGDLLVGADGLQSRTRRLIDAAAPEPRFSGQLSLGGVSRRTTIEPTPDRYQMMFGRRAFFGFSVPRASEAYWFANVDVAALPAGRHFSDLSAAEWRALLLTLFADDIGPAREMIETTDDEIGAYPVYDLPTVPRWSSGRLVLLGDAAHATSPNAGQGAALALEDALVLARCLRDGIAEGSSVHDAAALERAFSAYERARRGRVERVVRYSAQIGDSKIPGPVGRFFRDAFMPLALRFFATEKAQRWLYAHHEPWETALSSDR